MATADCKTFRLFFYQYVNFAIIGGLLIFIRMEANPCVADYDWRISLTDVPKSLTGSALSKYTMLGSFGAGKVMGLKKTSCVYN